jgi:hypothetical protein
MDGREDPTGGRDMRRIARGASWAANVEPVAQWARCAYRIRFDPGGRSDNRGLRFTAPRHLQPLGPES